MSQCFIPLYYLVFFHKKHGYMLSTRTWTLRQCGGIPHQTPRCSFGILSSKLFYILQTLWTRSFLYLRSDVGTQDKGSELQISAWLPKAESAKPCPWLTVSSYEFGLVHVAGLCLLVLGSKTPFALRTGILSTTFMAFHDWQEKRELGDATLNQRLYAQSTTGWFILCNTKGSPKSCCHSCRVIFPLHIHLLKVNESFLKPHPARSQRKHTAKLPNLFS